MVDRHDDAIVYRRSLEGQICTVVLNLGGEAMSVPELVGHRVLVTTVPTDIGAASDGIVAAHSALVATPT
jgi:hypothetical protein